MYNNYALFLFIYIFFCNFAAQIVNSSIVNGKYFIIPALGFLDDSRPLHTLHEYCSDWLYR